MASCVSMNSLETVSGTRLMINSQPQELVDDKGRKKNFALALYGLCPLLNHPFTILFFDDRTTDRDRVTLVLMSVNLRPQISERLIPPQAPSRTAASRHIPPMRIRSAWISFFLRNHQIGFRNGWKIRFEYKVRQIDIKSSG